MNTINFRISFFLLNMLALNIFTHSSILLAENKNNIVETNAFKNVYVSEENIELSSRSGTISVILSIIINIALKDFQQTHGNLDNIIASVNEINNTYRVLFYELKVEDKNSIPSEVVEYIIHKKNLNIISKKGHH